MREYVNWFDDSESATEEARVTFLQSVVGRRYAMTNHCHASATTLIFHDDETCDAWNLTGNQFRVLSANRCQVRYIAGNRAVDTIDFDMDYRGFRGCSNLGWKLTGFDVCSRMAD